MKISRLAEERPGGAKAISYQFLINDIPKIDNLKRAVSAGSGTDNCTLAGCSAKFRGLAKV